MTIYKFKDYISYHNEYNEYHREGGPAIEYINGSLLGRKEYYIDGELHRLDGPAVILSNLAGNIKKWYYHGKYIKCRTQKEFERIIKLAILF